MFDLSATGTGVAGTACATRVFNIDPTVPARPSGQLTFTPADALPVILAAPNGTDNLDACEIAFTFDVVQRPAANRDPVPGTPSRETQQLASVEGTASFNGNSGGGTGASTVTVLAAAILEINTVASVAPGTPSPGLQDTATIVTPPNTPSPTGTLTFRLFGPGDANCDGIQDGGGAQPVRTDTVAVTGTGPFTSDPFPPTAPGEYRFIVTYTGDNNFDGFVTGCDDPGEQITIAPPQIAIVKTASLPGDPPPPDNGRRRCGCCQVATSSIGS